MKNIFLIGRFNRITQDFNSCLSEKYHVQLGSDNGDIIRGMLAMNPPDLIVINLMAMDNSHEPIFKMITEQYPKLPVICVGNKDEVKQFEGVMKGDQYKKLVRPISNPELLEIIGGIFAKQKWEQNEIAGKAEDFVRQDTETPNPREFKKPVVEKKPQKIKEDDDNVTLDDYETLKAQIEAMIDVAEEDLSKETTPKKSAATESKSFGAQKKAVVQEPEEKPKQQILLVDDNAIQLRALKGALQKYYDISMATSGKEAVHMIEKKLPDMVFLDYEMPEWNGRMTLEQIRQIPGAATLPVVFLTGVKNKENIKSVLGLNPAGYLLKPASQDMIMDTIQKILGGK